MAADSSVGSYFYDGWEFKFQIERTSSEGILAGSAYIYRNGTLHCVLASSGVAKSRQQLIEGLKSSGANWVRERGKRERQTNPEAS